VATESDLRDLLRGPDPEGRGEIDLDAVLSRTRRRRRPRVIAAQALGSVALVGVLGTAIFASDPLGARDVMMSAEEDSGAGADEIAGESATLEDGAATKWQPDACGEPVTEVASIEGLALKASVDTTIGPDEEILATVTLRNEGSEPFVGLTSPWPYVSVARDGVVVWHSYEIRYMSGQTVDLAPGESMTFNVASVDRHVCDGEDDSQSSGAGGTYELHAFIDVITDDGPRIVTASPPVPLEIIE
jgi:hypothetical protein